MVVQLVRVVIVIAFLFYADSIIQETFLTTKPTCWDLAGIRERMLRDNGFVSSVGLSAATRMENAYRNGGRDPRDLGRFVTSQCLFLLRRIISLSVPFVQPVVNVFCVQSQVSQEGEASRAGGVKVSSISAKGCKSGKPLTPAYSRRQ